MHYYLHFTDKETKLQSCQMPVSAHHTENENSQIHLHKESDAAFFARSYKHSVRIKTDWFLYFFFELSSYFFLTKMIFGPNLLQESKLQFEWLRICLGKYLLTIKSNIAGRKKMKMSHICSEEFRTHYSFHLKIFVHCIVFAFWMESQHSLSFAVQYL